MSEPYLLLLGCSLCIISWQGSSLAGSCYCTHVAGSLCLSHGVSSNSTRGNLRLRSDGCLWPLCLFNGCWCYWSTAEGRKKVQICPQHPLEVYTTQKSHLSNLLPLTLWVEPTKKKFHLHGIFWWIIMMGIRCRNNSTINSKRRVHVSDDFQ